MPADNAVPSTAWEACTKIVEAATKACSAPPSPPTAAQPNWDAMANSFASLSVALTVGSIVLAVIALVAGLAWGKVVTDRAENEARTEARKCAKAYIDKWLAEDAPGIVRTHVEYLNRATLGSGDNDTAADAMGKAAG